MRSTIGNRKSLYKTNNTELASRLWLNITSSTENFDQLLLAYIDGATINEDRLYDAHNNSNSKINIYSIVNENPYKIQGRPAENIKQNEVITMGLRLYEKSDLKISIDRFENEFVNKSIILRDKYLSIDHNLKLSDYSFNSDLGTFNDRFELILGDNSMSTNEYESTSLIVYNSENSLMVNDNINTIKKVSVYDLTGRLISEETNENNSQIAIKKVTNYSQVLILKVEYLDGGIINKKVLF